MGALYQSARYTRAMSAEEDPGEHAAQLHERAITLREAGAYREAEAVCREAVEIFRASEGSYSPNLANALVERARLLELLDRLAEAGPASEEALTILLPLLDDPSNEPAVADELTRLTIRAEGVRASTLRARGALALAEDGYRRALVLAEARLPAGDPLIAETLNGLGVVHKFQGRYEEAEPLYRRALAIAESAGLTDDAATLFHNLGGLAHSRGDFAAGEPLARRAVEMREAALGPNHPATAADRAAWGALLEGLGRGAEAEQANADALRVFEARLGPRSLEAASALTALGGVQHQRGALDDAERSYRRALAIRQSILDRQHFDLAMTENNLGMLLAERGALDEARALLAHARDAFCDALGAEHPHTRTVAQNLSALDHPSANS